MNEIGVNGGGLTPGQDRVLCTPTPSWIDHQPYQEQLPDDQTSCIANGVARLLSDVQIDISGSELAWHYRTAQRVLTKEGADRAAHVLIEFDPGFQRLEVHFIRVRRDDAQLEHARFEDFQLFRRETSLDRLVLDGRLTASLLIPDVRVGDIVEVGCTLYGGASALKSKFAAWAAFDCFNPGFDDRYRLLRPCERTIFRREFNDPPAAIVSIDGVVEDSRWHLVGQKKRDKEPLTPPWLIQKPALQFSEFSDWNEVARLLAPFYEIDAVPPSLATEIDQLAKLHDDPRQRAAEWLRFVQQQLRYFALSIGEGGAAPRDLDAIWRTRFGDCKDKASLYVAGARRLGLDACAALVSTTHGYVLDQFLPSPTLFDHCIVCVRLDGRIYWLDPTLGSQCGDLDKISQPHTGWALPIASDTVQLMRLPDQEAELIARWDEDLRIGPTRDVPAEFRRRIEFAGWFADAMRSRIANDGVRELAANVLKGLQALWPKIAETNPLEIEDDQHSNTLALTFRYEIHDGWKSGAKPELLNFDIADVSTNGELVGLNGAAREADIYLGRPRRIIRELYVELPCEWTGATWEYVHKSSGLTFVDRSRVDGRSIFATRELSINKWSLPAREADAYGHIVTQSKQNVLTLFAPEKYKRLRPAGRQQLDHKLRIAIWFGIAIVWALWSLSSSFTNVPHR